MTEKTKSTKRKQTMKKLVEEILAMPVPISYMEKQREDAGKGDLFAGMAAELEDGATVKKLAAVALVAKLVKGDTAAVNLVLSLTGEKPEEKERSRTENGVKVVIEDIKTG